MAADLDSEHDHERRAMSDTPSGEGWWLASDGKYYPPQSATLPTFGTHLPPTQPPGQKRGFRKWLLIGLAGFFALFLMIGVIGALAPPEEQTATNASAASGPTATEQTAAASAPTSPPVTESPKPAPTTEAPKPPPTTAKPTTTTEAPRPTLTTSQKNAQRKADSYLDMTAFSRKGLIEQLEFEGFSTADATFGVDSLNADWNKQAAKKARGYLEMSAFSRSGLIEQLEFEGFTPEQAAYGVSTTGL